MSNLHPLYLQDKVLEKVRIQLKDQGFIQLHSILPTLEVNKLRKLFVDGQKKYLPDSHSYTNHKSGQDFVKKLLEKILNKKIKPKFELRSYKHKDYTLLHDNKVKKQNLFILDLTKEWNNQSGGEEIVVENNDLIIPVQENSLSIVLDVEKHYTKYINHLAKEKKLVIIGYF